MTFEFIDQQLQQQQAKQRYRNTITVTASDSMKMTIAGKEYLNFSSNDYLGLSQHPEITLALQEGANRFGCSASASSLITGNHYAHDALKDTICQWLNKESCLLFSSGFAANVGVLQALANEDVSFWLDKLSHASLIDGAFGSKAKVKRYLHNDINQLDKLLDGTKNKNNLIISEGVFSMDGDQANWPALARLAKKHNAWLYSDEAHSIGVIGQEGQGSCSHTDINIVMATFGKAIATSGAFVACDNNVAEYLTNFSRHFIYSTAVSPAIAWASKKSIEIIQKDQWRREKIIQLSELLTSLLDPSIDLIATQSSIHGIVLGSEEKTLLVSEKLKKDGFWVSAIRPPTVANNSSRLRVTISALHKENDINRLARSINEAVN